jgi:hypothetical protein
MRRSAGLPGGFKQVKEAGVKGLVWIVAVCVGGRIPDS